MATLPYPGPYNADREGYGLAPETRKTRKKREDCALRVLSLLRSDCSDTNEKDLAAISEVKGLFNRTHRQDQWDWYRVWCHLGCPPKSLSKPAGSNLGSFRRALARGDANYARELKERLCERNVDAAIECYLSGYTSHAVDVIYVLGHGLHSDLFTVGITTEDALEDVMAASRSTRRRLGVQAAWSVRPETVALSEIHNELHPWRVRSLYGAFDIDLGDARDIIEEIISETSGAETSKAIAA